MTKEAIGSYMGHKDLKHTIPSYPQFIENGQAKLGQHHKLHQISSIILLVMGISAPI